MAAQGLEAPGREQVAAERPHAALRLPDQEAHYPADVLCIPWEALVELAVLHDHLPARAAAQLKSLLPLGTPDGTSPLTLPDQTLRMRRAFASARAT